MAKKRKKAKKNKSRKGAGRSQQAPKPKREAAPPAPSPAPAATSVVDDAAAVPPQRPKRAPKWFLAMFAIAGFAFAAWMAMRKDQPKPKYLTNIVGEKEACLTCHRAGGAIRAGKFFPHKAVKGHSDLAKLGCTTCHGGTASALDIRAHQPTSGATAFLGKLPGVACARCHVPGSLSAAADQRGASLYLASQCVSCHLPGGPADVGPDLTKLPLRPAAQVVQQLVAPRRRNPQSAMWSLRDATYRGRYADNDQGNRNLRALTEHVLVLADGPARQRLKAAWHRPKQRSNAACGSCHQTGGKASGEQHTCVFLKKSKDVLGCGRCHGGNTKLDQNKTCPQVRSQQSLCAVCHLRKE